MSPDEPSFPQRIRNLLGKLLIVWQQHVWPGLKTFAGLVYTTTRQRIFPAVAKGSSSLKGELVKIHKTQNWMQRCGATLTGNAAGLAMAMLATKVVESLVETRQASNLWGLLADRPLVSETTFEVLSFVVEYVFALTIFTITEYYIVEYRRRRESNEGITALTDERE